MDIAERRIVGALLLVLGFSFLAVGIYTGQMNSLVEMLKAVFRTF